MPGRAQAKAGQLGQHFLGSSQLAARLVADAQVGPDDRVVDLGAGTGVLTAALAARAATVLAVEIDPALADGLARRFAVVPNVTVLHADACAVPLPVNPYRVVANPPFGRTGAILRRLLDDPAGGFLRADVVVQWQVARHRAQVSAGGARADLLGAVWAPWWEFARARRLPAAAFRPRPAVDAAVLVITRRASPLLEAAAFEPYAGFVRRAFEAGAGAPQIDVNSWAARFGERP